MRPKIYLFGDSITEWSFAVGGWGASLANRFNRTADVVFRGYSGYNTRWALKVIGKVFPLTQDETPPLAVTVFFGANDACVADRCSAYQHVPIHEYKQNLHSIVSFLKGRWPTTEIVLISPPPIDEPARLLNPYGHENKSGLPERTNEAAGNYAKASLAVAAECGVLSVDLWTKMQQIPSWQTACLSDGLHLTQTGNKIVFEEVIEALKKKGLSVETLQVDLPVIDDIDPNDPLKSFEGI